jgi:2-C-methyl-D-erythritol 4-phosphate cytidylyltransferase
MQSTSIGHRGIKGIILMGGAGVRFGSTTPKQFHRLAGKKVYLHTLEVFLKMAHFETIILVCPDDWLKEVEGEVALYRDQRIRVVVGGATRQESSYLGLLACGKEAQYVVIHDAVRPFVTREILLQNITTVIQEGAVDTCIPSADTVVQAENGEKIACIPRRSDYFRGQTPQSFYYPLILKAHERAKQYGVQNASDDCSLVLALGHPIKIISGSEQNIKLTTELDLYIAEQILRLTPVSLTTSTSTSLAGKRFAITGGTGGIGQAIAKQLRVKGATPFLISRSSSQYPADLTSATSTREIFSQIQREHGHLDGLINSIGSLTIREISQLFPEEIESLIATNLTGIIYSCKYAPIREGGHIINIASSSYIRGKKDYAIYASAKAAVVNFTQGLAEERADLRVNVLVPQRTNTSMRHLNFPNEDRSTLLEPDEVADALLNILQSQDLTGTITEVRKKYTADT